MSDSFIQVPTDSTGKQVDTRTESTNGNHRQVMVIGDPTTNTGIAPVDVTKGLAVDLTATGQNSTALKTDGSAVTQPVKTEQQLDYDSGGGTANLSLVGLALPASGGPVAGGTSTNPFRVDPTGTTPQPVNPISGQVGVAAGAGAVGVTTQRMTLASDDPAVAVLGATTGAAVITDVNGTIQQYLRGIVKLAITIGGWLVTASGDVAHDAVDSGNPVKVGAKGIAYGTNPTDVTADDRTNLYANRAGILHVLNGHPNVITRRDNFTSAQTDVALITISTGTKIVILSCTVAADKANSVNVAVRTGFGTANTPTGAGTYLSHPGIPAGGGIREAGAVCGANDEDFRITCGAPTSGSIDVVTKYFTIAS